MNPLGSPDACLFADGDHLVLDGIGECWSEVAVLPGKVLVNEEDSHALR